MRTVRWAFFVLSVIALDCLAEARDDTSSIVKERVAQAVLDPDVAPRAPTNCETCCSPGATVRNACARAFKGGPGTCCGYGTDPTTENTAFCCPSRANEEVGYARCAPSEVDGGFRCHVESNNADEERPPGRGTIQYDRFRPGRAGRYPDGAGPGAYERAEGISPFTLFLSVIFTSFLVKGCLVRQREQIQASYQAALRMHALRRRGGSRGRRDGDGDEDEETFAVGIPCGPDGAPLGPVGPSVPRPAGLVGVGSGGGRRGLAPVRVAEVASPTFAEGSSSPFVEGGHAGENESAERGGRDAPTDA